MIEIAFPQPCKPLTLNQRHHWTERAKLTSIWRTVTFVVARNTGHRNLPRSVVQVVIPVRSLKVRRDPHNFYSTAKACIDGLVDAGLFKDDTPEYLMTIEPDFKQGGDVVIKIWERGEWLATML